MDGMILDPHSAEWILSLLDDDLDTDERDGLLTGLLQHPGFRAWQETMWGTVSEEFTLALQQALGNGVSQPFPWGLPLTQANALQTILNLKPDVSRLRQSVVHSRCLPIADAVQRTLAALPAETRINGTIYIMVDGTLSGFGGKNAVFLDIAMFPPVYPEKFVLPTLMHELHHVGQDFWRVRDTATERMACRSEGCRWLVTALDHVAQEGIADMYFTPYDLAPLKGTEAHWAQWGITAETVARFHQAVDGALDQFPKLLEEFGRHLLRLAQDAFTADDHDYAVHIAQITVPPSPRPLAHLLGETMIQTIRDWSGDEGVFRIIEHLNQFLPEYQRAAQGLQRSKLPSGVVDRIASLWNRE